MKVWTGTGEQEAPKSDEVEWQQIGEGAFAKVYLLGKEGSLQACKVSSHKRKLQEEAGCLQRIQHPLFPEYLGYEEDDGHGYLYMEYIQGDTLRALVEKGESFNEEIIISWMEQLAEGLEYLHDYEGGYLFRDLKLENILLQEDGRVRLIDFGCVCRIGEAKSIAGTPGISAPEQFQEDVYLEPSADVYALGKVLEELLCKEGRNRMTDKGTDSKRVSSKEAKRKKMLHRQTCKMVRIMTCKEQEKRLPSMGYVLALCKALNSGDTESFRGMLDGRFVFYKHIVEL